MSEPLYGETVTPEEALAFMHEQITEWNFQRPNRETASTYLLTQIGHWGLEAFGQRDSNGNLLAYSRFGYGEGFDSYELPEDLQNLTLQEHIGEVYVTNGNNIRLTSNYVIMEEDPVVPKWDELEALETFEQMVSTALADQEIIKGIKASSFGVVPGFNLTFTPQWDLGWGLHYSVSSYGSKVVPFGKVGYTDSAYSYAVAVNQDVSRLTATIADLVYLGLKYAQPPRSVPVAMLDSLIRRVRGEEVIDISKVKVQTKPGNAVQNLLVETVLQKDQQRETDK